MYKFKIVVTAKHDDRDYHFSLNGTTLEDVEEKVMRMANGNWTIKSISRTAAA